MAYTTPEDIANRALQHCGIPPSNRITALTDATKNAKEIVACYDGLRRAELRANPWRFAIRRSVLRALSATSLVWTPPAYAAGTTYSVGAVVSGNDGAGSRYWISKIGSNLGNTPGGAASAWESYFGTLYADTWSATVTYYTGDLVVVGGVVYFAVASSLNHTPPNATYWTAQGGTTVAAQILYPLKSGPVSEDSSDNAYPLPNGWLANAAQEPHTSIATNLVFGDWRFEGGYIVSRETQPIILRFVADITEPAQMDGMFAEAFAARIAMEICESLTQSNLKLSAIGDSYSKSIDDAKGANNIEVGPLPTGGGFNVAEDIANRALQFCGVDRIGSFADNTRAAQETQFCYNKSRAAELRRNVWTFAVRYALLRPLDTNSRLWTPPTYLSSTTYAAGQVVAISDGFEISYWLSRLGSNTGHNPLITPTYWTGYFGPVYGTLHDSGTTYSSGDIAYLAGPVFYLSLVDSNADTPPSSKWVALGGTTSAPVYPSPNSWTQITNAVYSQFPLPSGWLVNAPQNPKAGSYAVLGAPSNVPYDDWQVENGFIRSKTADPINLRFAADVRNVAEMDPMFCDALAARIAMSVFLSVAPGRIVTGPDGRSTKQPPSRGDLAEISTIYQKFISEARNVNGIEQGPTEPPLDDYLATRS